jgi:hypothetical protein
LTGAQARAGLLPREAQRRHQAVMNEFWNSRRVTVADAAGRAAGLSPARPANPPRLIEANSPPVVANAPPAEFFRSPGVRMVVSYEYARRWAVANGLCHRRNAMDLKVVNAARREMGLVLFVLKGSA